MKITKENEFANVRIADRLWMTSCHVKNIVIFRTSRIVSDRDKHGVWIHFGDIVFSLNENNISTVVGSEPSESEMNAVVVALFNGMYYDLLEFCHKVMSSKDG